MVTDTMDSLEEDLKSTTVVTKAAKPTENQINIIKNLKIHSQNLQSNGSMSLTCEIYNLCFVSPMQNSVGRDTLFSAI